MFSLLNSHTDKGKDTPRMCKILDSLSEVFHGIRTRFGRLFYLLEGKRLNRDGLLLWVGLRIAFFLHLTALARIRSGKA